MGRKQVLVPGTGAALLVLVLVLASLGIGKAVPATADRPALGSPLLVRALAKRPLHPRAGSPEQRVRAAWLRGDAQEALKLAQSRLKRASAAEAVRLNWLAARNADDAQQRARHLARVIRSGHELSRWARLLRAEALLESDPKTALGESKTLTDDWAGAARARKLYALALHDAGEAERALPLLERLNQERRAAVPALDVTLRLAQTLGAQDDLSAVRRAVDLYRTLGSRTPIRSHAAVAEQKIRELLTRLPAQERRRYEHPTIEDAFARATALFRARRYEAAGEAYAALLERVHDDDALTCKVRLEQGRVLLRLRKREQAAALMTGIADSCASDEIKAWARYYAGRAYYRTGQHDAALRQLAQLGAKQHRLADDALYISARIAFDDGDEVGGGRFLTELLEHHPEGDMCGQARFALAWQDVKAHRLEEALRHFDEALGAATLLEANRARLLYWRARTLSWTGRAARAREDYEWLVRNRPLSYYAQQALGRLEEIAPKVARELRAQLKQTRGVIQVRPTAGSVTRTPAFKRALALLRVGEFALAGAEFSWLGMTGASSEPQTLRYVAGLLHDAGAYAQASRLVRSRLGAFRHAPMDSEALALWRIAYPKAYAPLIEHVADKSSVPASFLRAVVREESRFNPSAVSRARAYGLIQLIGPTARTYGRQLGLPSNPAALRVPEINLRIGARFISQLWQRYARNPAVVPSAYNAGPGAAERWLRQRPQRALDEWIEEIPYLETRRYTKRVLASWSAYTWLDTGRLPRLSRTLPQL